MNTDRKDRAANFNFPADRHQIIRDRLAQHGRVIAADLALEFGISEDSVRRDLRELAAAGACLRVYGGAIAMAQSTRPIQERAGEHVGRKQQLARAAARLVQGGQLVFLDSGTTNVEIARQLPEDIGLTVATNSPAVAVALTGRDDIKVVLIGGSFDPQVGGTLGTQASSELQRMHPDLCFIGICSIDAQAGIGAGNAEDAAFKRQLAASCGALVAVATNEKLGTGAPFAIADIADINHLVVEADADAQQVARLRDVGVDVIIAH
ncbi:DeoR/GlpR family DNA-binding transcription regulator [Amantichitinum ursilacus]|uniref:HTH-type transcriptional repressor GlcR n=1 Tax=Amantichitinum ursilacus TaxID=857265 RepID=A0A0N0XKI6_9NEIS|nr:DeoR/GlpR family DNA-binding transcription regulator [Amantichitinum ursilacus]KPC54727.1 HTH-type transcriptional repressor GlcR [Amantichitinum ursilacus]